jgi:hypothetical protein
MPLGPRELALRAQREARFAGKPAIAAPVDTLRAKPKPVDTKPVDKPAGRYLVAASERLWNRSTARPISASLRAIRASKRNKEAPSANI